jgi:hypothetical protein
MTSTSVAPEVRTQIPLDKVMLYSWKNGDSPVTVDGIVITATGLVLGVPVQLAEAKLKIFMVALATGVFTTTRCNVPEVALTVVVAADVIYENSFGFILVRRFWFASCCKTPCWPFAKTVGVISNLPPICCGNPTVVVPSEVVPWDGLAAAVASDDPWAFHPIIRPATRVQLVAVTSLTLTHGWNPEKVTCDSVVEVRGTVPKTWVAGNTENDPATPVLSGANWGCIEVTEHPSA